ncbi:CHAP domain-containing protein [Arthrobacter sp. AET 35A]|uniref:CHAP domain-containing protein n=1 Tax=Arthrobacter sp. AET 35A TaxID=2292643 RepID=UPI001781B72C|nr:CHAP domain-containing protein [Arthrobacter sp. AET 35A]MBE0011618.1 CHAP domain-containing protein [Arthrobacter sp. AET 35A]
MQSKGLFYTAVVLVPTLFLGLILMLVLLGGSDQPASANDCTPASDSEIDPEDLPTETIAGYSGEQLVNAALIVSAGEALDLSVKGQTIGVMTAMGESSLQVLDRGDGPGPDSRGLFQQRDNGAWGSYEDRMDPTISSTNFFNALQDVDGWESLSPSEAAHRVQRNADPFHYTQYWTDAIDVVEAVADIEGLETCLTGGPQLGGEGDDLPWPNSPYCAIGGTCPPGAVSPLGMYNRECTDFALWRLNSMAGVTSDPWKFHNSDLTLGNAEQWLSAWNRQGWDSGQEPEVGAVAYYAANVGGAGSVGHVAIVAGINDDGTVAIEEYNGMAPPDDHQYSTRNIQPDEVSAYLYFPGDD